MELEVFETEAGFAKEDVDHKAAAEVSDTEALLASRLKELVKVVQAYRAPEGFWTNEMTVDQVQTTLHAPSVAVGNKTQPLQIVQSILTKTFFRTLQKGIAELESERNRESRGV